MGKKKKIRAEKENLLLRLKRIEGQTQGLVRMLEEDAYCIDLLTQIAAVRAALLSVAKIVLKDHMHSCVAQSFKAGQAGAAIDEIDTVLSRFVK